jgi:hypothetical protein
MTLVAVQWQWPALLRYVRAWRLCNGVRTQHATQRDDGSQPVDSRSGHHGTCYLLPGLRSVVCLNPRCTESGSGTWCGQPTLSMYSLTTACARLLTASCPQPEDEETLA